ncbi:LysR family transcriptional regulator [Streptacidiphilus sp. P02-A3a]|uniref:LysR family transcriptional regulator n=1 Tax=Streptacidiphilus sp. P02-A3a TaxID=2704468 RepID=UPI0015F8DF40|nr:LysR family transcriptional regulator [Streptacidiphilus sp. P02-A3a]QMU71530.1 LysR family transcriptional regulator [Streptacidiphilus sp. P02-A3a]
MAETVGFTLTQLRYFVVAAETGSMTAAAERLLIAQSAVSTAVSNLEHELGVQLFIRRRGKGLVTTPAGERLMLQARELLSHALDVAAEARGVEGGLSGPARIGCFVTLAPFVLPKLLAAAEERHPRLRIEVLEGEAGELDQALRTGRIDFAITYDLGLGPGIARETLASLPAHALVAAGHPLAGRGTVDLAELAHEPLVLLDLPHSRDYFWSLVTATGITPVIRHRSHNYEAVRSLVALGHGFSVLHQRPATEETYSGARVAVLALTNEHPPLDLVLARMDGVRQTARAAAVARLACELLAPAVLEPEDGG